MTRLTNCTWIGIFLAILLLVCMPASAASTEVTVIKYANDATTVLDQETVDIPWMETNLPVYGNGETHYYFQGPTFDPGNLWDPAEEVNVLSRDYGAVKGTDVRDLCNLVGGMNAGEYVTIKATDNFAKSFDYNDVYTPDPNTMRMVLAWYNGEEGSEGQGIGYPPDFYTGMRLFFFADTSTNPWGYHVFGNWDMHENLAENRWHYYYDGTFWPSSSGLSVKYVNRVLIYSDDPPPPPPISADFTANVTSGLATLTIQFTDTSTGGPTAWQWNFGDGTSNSTLQNPVHTFQKAGGYTISLTVSNAQGSDGETKAGFIKASYRLNCGAPPSTYTDTSGLLWLKDKKYTTGGYGYVTAGKTAKTTTAIANTLDDYLYQYWRYNTNADLKYDFSVTNGNYQVTLKFVEPNYNDNRRVFNILIEGITKASSYRIYDQAGGRYKAKDEVYTATVSDGILNVHLQKLAGSNNPSGRNNPLLCAVEVRPV